MAGPNPGTPIPVVDPYGNLGTIDSSEAHAAFQKGDLRPASPDEISESQNEQQYGEGLGNSLKAFGAGAARAASFGLSDQALTHLGGVEPNTLKQLKERHGLASGLGEATGIIGSLALAPEASPVGLLSKAGRAVTETAAPAAEGLASLAANTETSPAIHAILSKAGSHALGSAVEGAAYGLGQSVSEDALGDPGLNGEKLLSNIGYGALFGGGVGALLGPLARDAEGITDARALPEKAELAAKHGTEVLGPDAGKVTEAQIPENPTLEQALDFSGAPEQTKKGLIEGLAEQKPNASEIAQAAQDLGAPLMEGQVSANQQVQRWDSLLTQSPSFVGVKRQEMYAAGVKRASDAVQSTLGDGGSMSLAELGDALKESLTQKLTAQSEPISQLYNELKQSYEAIPLNPKSLKQIAGNIRKLEGVDVSPQAASLANDFADRLSGLESVDQLKRFKTAINQELPGIPSVIQKRVTGLVAEKLTNLEENSILSFAEREMKTPEAKERILGLLEQRKSADAAYSSLRDKMSELGDVLGKKRIQGPQDFLNHIDEMTPEKFATRLFSKNNSEFLGWFSKEFSEESNLLTQYHRSEILKAATKTGELRPNEVFKALSKMPQELKNLLFNPEQQKLLNSAKLYLDSIPKNINPSGTSMAEAYRRMTNPLSSVIEHAKDYAVLKGIKSVVGDTSGSLTSGNSVSKLSAIERAIQKTSQGVSRGAKGIFAAIETATPRLAGYFGSADPEESESKTQKLIESLGERANNPETLIDSLDKSTTVLYPVAPKLTGGVHETAARATQFLSSKVPSFPPKKALSPKYKPSRSEIAKFHRYVSVVEDPTSVLDQVRDGTLTPESMETLTNVYPKLYSEMQQSVLEHLTNHLSKKENHIPYKTKLGLSLFFGQDLDNSLDPMSIQSNQAMMASMGMQQANQQAEQKVRTSQEGLSKLDISKRILTAQQTNNQREKV